MRMKHMCVHGRGPETPCIHCMGLSKGQTVSLDPSRGTPKTLREAIENGCDQAGCAGKVTEDSVEKHVVDLLRQKFTVAYFAAEIISPAALAIVQKLAEECGIAVPVISPPKKETRS